MNKQQFSDHINAFEFSDLFNELGWDQFKNSIPIAVKEDVYELKGIVEKRGFVILHLSTDSLPNKTTRRQIEQKAGKAHHEHLIIFSDSTESKQIWQLALKEENKPRQVHEVTWHKDQDTQVLYQRLRGLLFTLDEEEKITLIDVKQRVSENFARNTDRITKKFYTEFKKQHTAFLKFIQGIDDAMPDKENPNKQWYASLMLNRLMFCYFIQKKGFLNRDFHYLQNKLKESREKAGSDKFYSFYRDFLLALFHEGLGKPESARNTSLDLGQIPYLNGGLFDVHELELSFQEIEISDDAFQKIFDFFDQWNWHLDNREESTGRDINPDVIGYIFEKYINDRAAMGAYYTKEDITDYIGKNTIIPFLFDEVKRNYKKAFAPDESIWQHLKSSRDQYIYDAVKKGVPQHDTLFDDLPDEIKAGFQPGIEKQLVTEEEPHLWQLRMLWNKPAPEDITLPTETYRELITRRKHCDELRSKINNGEITEINDLITYNLDIRQYAQDVVETIDDPVFIREFYKALKKITILDPTCGSGAFLFAALNILEPLYEACITRMEQYVADEPRKYKFFNETLAEVNSVHHPNLAYFIYKNIILHNLYGVDIMKEAVEIAKLRLFLKLMGAVDVDTTKPNFGLEPLPDIDFNIRAGNTLVGFATESEMLTAIQNREALFADKILDEFKEDCQIVSQAFSRFQDAQLIEDQGSEDFRSAKQELNTRLKTLNDKLNEYLATNYGIDAEKEPEKYTTWLSSHQPFHWFAEFYRIMAGNGGFDVIIGNPPYVVYSSNSAVYSIHGYHTLNCANLYAYCTERSFSIIHPEGSFGFIIPNSSISADKLSELQEIITTNKITWVSNYAWRPAKLFEGANMLLAVVITRNHSDNSITHSSPYYRWYNEYRKFLLDGVKYSTVNDLTVSGSIPKLISNQYSAIHKKLESNKKDLTNFKSNRASNFVMYYFRAVLYWVKILDRIPFFQEDGVPRVTGEMKPVHFEEKGSRDAFISLFSSSLYFTYYTTWSSCQVINSRDFKINFDFDHASDQITSRLSSLAEDLEEDFQRNSNVINRSYSSKGRSFEMEKQYFYLKKSKPIIDQIDTVLAQHYGFTEEELDFITNYDIKYRMGRELEAYVEGKLGKVSNED